MAHSYQARKRIRQADRRTDINRSRRSRVRTYVRQVEAAIAANDKVAAMEALKAAEPVLAISGHQGILKANTASRRISRLTRLVNAINDA